MEIIDILKNKKTKYLAMSLAKFPGRFGIKVHNHMLNSANIDAEYFACTTKNLKSDMQILRNSPSILGCGISMPYKIEVIDYLDEISLEAKKIGSVNTVINRNGKLFGINTDVVGAKWALNFSKGKIALLGNGGMSKCFQYSLINSDYTLITRNNWNLLEEKKFDTIINATSIGLLNDESPVNEYSHDVAIDVVVKMTTLVKKSKKSINGIEISLRQAAEQFQNYFEIPASIEIMRESVKELYDN